MTTDVNAGLTAKRDGRTLAYVGTRRQQPGDGSGGELGKRRLALGEAVVEQRPMDAKVS